jgi:hypothetical protein
MLYLSNSFLINSYINMLLGHSRIGFFSYPVCICSYTRSVQNGYVYMDRDGARDFFLGGGA